LTFLAFSAIVVTPTCRAAEFIGPVASPLCLYTNPDTGFRQEVLAHFAAALVGPVSPLGREEIS